MCDILVRFKPVVSFCVHSFVKVREVKLTDICRIGAALMCKGGQTYIQTDRQARKDLKKITGLCWSIRSPLRQNNLTI